MQKKVMVAVEREEREKGNACSTRGIGKDDVQLDQISFEAKGAV